MTTRAQKSFLFFIIFISFFSCTEQGKEKRPDSEQRADQAKAFALKLNPSPNTPYSYEITTEGITELEIEGKTVENINKSTVNITYTITKDSSGNFLFHIQYDNIKLYSKNQDIETESEAANAPNSINPIEKMLGVLKDARLTAIVTPSGKIKEMVGYKEIGERIVAQFANADQSTREMAQKEWNHGISESLIRNNMNQLLGIFPDSAVHVRDSWQTQGTQAGEIPMNISSTYQLKRIEQGVAYVSSNAELSNQGSSFEMRGIGNVLSKLGGTQKANLEIDTNTGMINHNVSTGKIKGTLELMARSVPLTIDTKVEMKRTGLVK